MIQHDPANADIARFLRRLQWGLVAFAVGWVIWLLGPVLTPFVLAALIGWLGDPMVDRLERRGRSRAVAVTLVFTLMTLLVALVLIILVPMIERQIVTLIDSAGSSLLGHAYPACDRLGRVDVLASRHALFT